jgi:hypothetical protein
MKVGALKVRMPRSSGAFLIVKSTLLAPSQTEIGGAVVKETSSIAVAKQR